MRYKFLIKVCQNVSQPFLEYFNYCLIRKREGALDVSLIIPWMKKVPFFNSFSDVELMNLSKDKNLFLQFEPSEVIIQEGEKDHAMFIILKGTVLISKGVAKKDTLIAKLNEGEVFGEFSFLRKGANRTSTAISEKKTVLMTINPTTLENLDINLKSKFKDELLKVVLKRFEILSKKYSNLISSVERRFNGFYIRRFLPLDFFD